MRYALIPALFALSACAALEQIQTDEAAPTSIEDTSVAPTPPADARSVEDFDTTTAAQREEATNVSSGGASLGTTVASLGDASQPGFWMETPLVSEVTQGRLRNPATGRSVEVELRPISGGSSRVSLAALRLLEASLTELVSLEVFRS